MIYDQQVQNNSRKEAVYSLGNKLLVHFKNSDVKTSTLTVGYWNVINVSSVHIFLKSIYIYFYIYVNLNTYRQIFTPFCRVNLSGSTGTVKSPKYPAEYPNSSDCLWRIETGIDTKIRLLFAFFDTRENLDYVSVQKL